MREPQYIPAMQDIDELLAASAADDAFKADLAAYLAHQRAPRISVEQPAPRVKVLRVLAKLLHAEPHLAIERVHLVGWSGCSDFHGTLTAHAAGRSHVWDFVWDCRWRAEREELRTAWGHPDQSRAAREWGWDCFARWDARAPEAVSTGAAR